jgi:HNH endonuclease
MVKSSGSRFRSTTPAEAIEGRWEEDENGCHVWLRFKRNGYGRQRFQGKMWQAHVLAYIAAYGPLKPGEKVHHKCENKSCVNPKHLKALTDAGHSQEHSRFTPEDIRAIRADPRTLREIADEYGTHPPYIRSIKKGRSWQEG